MEVVTDNRGGDDGAGGGDDGDGGNDADCNG